MFNIQSTGSYASTWNIRDVRSKKMRFYVKEHFSVKENNVPSIIASANEIEVRDPPGVSLPSGTNRLPGSDV